MAVVAIPLSIRGLTGERDPGFVQTGDLKNAENLDFTSAGIVQKEGGSVKINSTVLTDEPEVMAGFDWWPAASVQRRVIATSDGKLYKDAMAGTFATELKSGLAADRITYMAEGGAESQGRNKKLFICNGANPVQVLSGDGATTSDLANPPADWSGSNQPTFIFPHRTYMIGGGNTNDPHRIYASLTTDHEDFLGAGVWNLSVFPGEGLNLVAGLSTLGKAFLWKYPLGIYVVTDADASPANWFVQPLARDIGIANTPHALCPIDNGRIAFVTATGHIVLMEETGGSLTGVQFTDLTKSLNLTHFLREHFNPARLHRTQLRWYDDKHQLHALFASATSNVEDRRLVIDFSSERPRMSVSTKDINESMWMEQDSDKIPRPIIGDNAGFVRKLDQISRTIDSETAYRFSLETVPTDFSDVNPAYIVKKLFYRLHLEFTSTGNYDINADIIIDEKTIGTVNFNQGSTASILPLTLPFTLAGTRLRRRSRDIAGEGYTFSVKIYETSIQNPKIARAWVEFDPLTPAR